MRLKRFYILILFFFGSTVTISVTAWATPKSCEAALHNRSFTIAPPSLHRNHGDSALVGEALAYDSNYQLIGSLEYYVEDASPTVFQIERTTVKKGWRKKGVYREMLTQTLELFPRVTAIHASALIETNRQVIRRHLKRNKSCLEAILTSPIAKVNLQLGFTQAEIFECREKEADFTLRMSRPRQ